MGDKIKTFFRQLDLKTGLRAASFIIVVVIVVITSIFSLGLDPASLNWKDWLTRTAILIFFSIYGTVFGESLGKDRSKKKADGSYQAALRNYLGVRQKVLDSRFVGVLEQWLAWDWARHDKSYRVTYLRKWGIKDPEAVLDNLDRFTDDSFLAQILKHPVLVGKDKDGEEIYLKRETQEQLDAVLDVLDGKVRLPVTHSAYYLDAMSERTASLDAYEIPRHITRTESTVKWASRISKIGTSILVSMFMGMLVVQSVMAADNTQGWMDLVTRLAALIMNIFSGYMIGALIISQETERIVNKEMWLRNFLDDMETGTFHPVSGNEETKKEYERWAKEHPAESAEEQGIKLLEESYEHKNWNR